MRMGRILPLAGCFLCVLLAGCTVGPDYHRTATWSPADWERRDAGDGVSSVVAAEEPLPAWWDVFGDAELSALERRAAQTNLDVRLATVRLAESRAQLRVTGADRYPSLNGTGAYTYQTVSNKLLQRGLQDAVGGAAGPLATIGLPAGTVNGVRQYAGQVKGPDYQLWQYGVDASWELDLWGRVRREVESARASVTASAEDRRAVLIAQLSEVARDYMMLRGTQALLAISRANLRTAQDIEALTRSRYTSGLTTELDVDNARTQAQTTAADIPNYEQQVAQQINALSLLLGEPPRALEAELDEAKAVPPLPPIVPVGVPSELARRRPDIREAEARLHAATADVGVAVANFYPKVTLTGALPFETLAFRDLAFWGAAMWSVGPSISVPIFEGGRLRGQLQLSQARQQEAAISYQQTVLGAWRDVDNALAAYADEQKRNQRLADSEQSAQRALDLAQSQYTHGLQTFLNVLNAQRTLLSTQQQLASSTATQSANLVQLYNALGGGWETTFPERADAMAKGGADEGTAKENRPG
ncbi:MAG: efflux transporter outer membrane subunit [Gluconacetobacter diazotrophicus]|nr:efflux transporter outer membrane subunit [Gluconacetobacter diazotrophicus]